jgi:hypothetical protein
MAHFHEYAQALSRGFRVLDRVGCHQDAPANDRVLLVTPTDAAMLVLQRLDYWHDRPRNMRGVIKLMLQDQLGLPPSRDSEIPGCDDDVGLRRFPNGVVVRGSTPCYCRSCTLTSRTHRLAASIALCFRAAPIEDKARVFTVLEASGKPCEPPVHHD